MDTRIKRIEFIEDRHEYWFVDKAGHRRQLHGVTAVISKMFGKSFPESDTVKLATLYGSTVHSEVEHYYNNGGILSTDGAKWVVDTLETFKHNVKGGEKIECEVKVSDFEGTASKVDVVLHTLEGAFLFDIKTTSHFDRPYCSLQLSVYKELYEACYDEKVLGLFVLGTKMKRLFRIFLQDGKMVKKVLDLNKGEEL